MDNCEHGLPQFLCVHCKGDDRNSSVAASVLASQVNPDNDEPINVAEHGIAGTIVAIEELHNPPDESVEKPAGNSASAMQQQAPTVLPSKHREAGKGGEGGDFRIPNADFIAAVLADLPKGAAGAVCSKPGNPTLGGWVAHRADGPMSSIAGPDNNNYLGCSSFYPGDDGSIKARKAQFAACHFLMLDDLGTKVPLDRLGDFELSWLIETSPGNHQGGIILDAPITDGAVAARLLNAVIGAGLCDAGAT